MVQCSLIKLHLITQQFGVQAVQAHNPRKIIRKNIARIAKLPLSELYIENVFFLSGWKVRKVCRDGRSVGKNNNKTTIKQQKQNNNSKTTRTTTKQEQQQNKNNNKTITTTTKQEQQQSNNNKTTATNQIFNKDDICKELCAALYTLEEVMSQPCLNQSARQVQSCQGS